MDFAVLQTCPWTGARAGVLRTRRGDVPTPAFLPLASQGSVKALSPQELKEIGIPMLLGNTYHLYLRPGIDVIKRLGDLHSFMAWEGPILTDSGGFQVFSLAHLSHIDDEGVTFRSHIDGSLQRFTPELAVRYQEELGAEVIMALDHCPAYTQDYEAVRQATERTSRWAERSLEAFHGSGQALFGIAQGGTFPDLRRESVAFITSLPFQGYALGGLSLGEPKELTWRTVAEAAPLLPKGKPRYLMGVGSPEDLVMAVSLGLDLFDSCLPTRVARNGALFTRTGRVNIRNARFKEMPEPVEPDCGCYTCRTFPAAYLHHLFQAGELLAYRLVTIHNLWLLTRLMAEMRQHILTGTFPAFKESFLAGYRPTDEETRRTQKEKWLARQRAKPEPVSKREE